ncbi:MAG: glycosyltransferase family 39 protein [Gammaproteobacteria bacterium]
MSRQFLLRRGWALAWAALVLVSYAVRTPVPIDETRYLSVAWEMWLRGNFLVPYLNGATYSHKPPLMFWLFQLGWEVFGVNGWWPRLVPPLFALGAMFLTAALARRLWPERPQARLLAPWLLAGSFYWAFYTSATMFDMILTAFAVAGMLGIWIAGQGRGVAGWLLTGVACGLGILTKGPVMLLLIAFGALLGPWWSDYARRRPLLWYGGLVVAIAIGAGLALSWALSAGYRGGAAYEEAILWHQTADRVVDSFAHRRGWWWYLPLLPVMLFPWLMWPPLYRAVAGLRGKLDRGLRFVIAWAVPTYIAFSLISGKQPHYLLPIFPAFALLAARALEQSPVPAGRWSQAVPAAFLVVAGILLLAVPLLRLDSLPAWVAEIRPLWGVMLAGLGVLIVLRTWDRATDAVMSLAVVSVVATMVFVGGFFQAARGAYDVTPAARYLSTLQHEDLPVAHIGTYHGQFQFFGRLRKPLVVLRHGQLHHWAEQHPNGRVVVYSSDPPPNTGPQPDFLQRYKGEWLAIWEASVLCSMPQCTPGGFLGHGAALPASQQDRGLEQ